jgi:phosphoribosylformimino-5-aminoimidazole carboxamide ribotide isomerase
MIVYAAIDLKSGRCVQLVGGRPEDERINLPEPRVVAESWVDMGFAALHVIDLDAAMGSGSNRREVEAILSTAAVPVQVGGGVRSEETAAELIARGADSVIVGTRAIRDPDWLARLSRKYPDRMVVAADVRDGEVVIEGWTQGAGIALEEMLSRLRPLPLAGVLVTDVGREGRLAGIDRELFRAATAATRHRILAAGGITTGADLEALATTGAAGAVIGMALYTGAIDPATTAKEYGR